MRRVGARELKKHTGAVIERGQRGERLLLTRRGSPLAIITSIDQDVFDELLNREAADAAPLAWLPRPSNKLGAASYWFRSHSRPERFQTEAGFS